MRTPISLSKDILELGPLGIAWLRPQHLLGLDLPPLVHGVLWSLTLNIFAYVTSSLARQPTSIERLQANLFVPSELAPMTPSFRLWRSAVTVEELTTTVSRYLGEERTRSSFESFAASRRLSLDPKQEADIELLRYAEHVLASAIGAASSRLVLSLLLRKRTVSTKAALKLLDDANAAIQYNREILQTALDHVRQGIAVFDKDLRLVCWNRQFGEVLDLPLSLTRVGIGLDEILRHNGERGALGPGPVEDLVNDRLHRYLSGEPIRERFAERGLVIEIRANHMPDGGLVTTATDVTPSVEAAEALERANENLERRVKERTEELTRLNDALGRAKGEAEEANISKTRFLAAASHDLLQPLNAARLYVTSLVERQGSGDDAQLVSNVDASLEAVEEILGALLDISRLDSGALRPEISTFRLDELMRQLEVEFAPMAREKGLQLGFVVSTRSVRSDRRLLRRLLQNLISNAIKYTPQGRVLIGCRLGGAKLRFDVYDTGLGIPKSKQRAIFQEFHRLDQGAKVARGLGLGLSIVERIARVLDHSVGLESKPGRGSHFSVTVPLAPPRCRSIPRSSKPQRMEVNSARRPRGALHRQRAENPRWHGDTARRLGLPCAEGSRSQGSTRHGRRRQDAAHGSAGRLSPRQRQRDRGDCGAALAFRRRAAGDPHHGGPLARRARGSARAGYPGAAEAAQAGSTACVDGPVAGHTDGGGGIALRTRAAATDRIRSWPPRSPPGCGSRHRASAGSPRRAPSRSLPRQ